ncbi:sensor histidine kinase [Cellulomonas fimi]|uniref:histidine kinase n=1 Tax=Cellulomonas fimi (strain ATCC 484 / DSM 20113 / JCM 1341 / CCUG 24087 / LMG 16345 / NBRC 15513 / NCIMB 8980 / NCTC 7547 / NRS-133) TaxID=590998 RepID=F4H1U2_CELFA|nr:histidine kinase [Cellulomonas fimi]AEE47512.1 integral membrane sensor signal transduction histidine kinase [Cellulomonas fimi ATCC 484]NNH05512.1 sensor histidine kinase [Cellulomonas fimi]VEH36429.1 Sensor histidine kinase desK [Cellulomonas fimi]
MATTTTPTPAPGAPVDDLRVVAPAFASSRDLLAAPYSGATWRAVAQLVIGWPWLLTIGLLVLTWTLTSIVLVPVFGVGLPMLLAGLVVGAWCARVERARLGAQTGALIPAPTYRRADRPGWWRWGTWRAVLSDGRMWAHQAYAVVAMSVSSLGWALMVGLGGLGLAAIAFPFYGAGSAVDDWSRLPWPLAVVAAVLVGVALVWLAALVAQGTALLTVRLARGMLGATAQSEALRQARAAADAARHDADRAQVRAEHLQETRTAAVGAADEERRRIERDLHDGAQQRLVALGVELGVAKRHATRDPDAAAAALDYAHREVKETLAELRDLVRGIHPAVLTDRGLDAALSALAARTPLAVTVDVPEPATLAVAQPGAQAAAYFVVAEALTNATKHAGAQSVLVEATVVHRPDGSVLRVVVADDGKGGATAAPGSGLDGLRSRVEALDGTFDLDSPAGGGTRLTVEVPCAS